MPDHYVTIWRMWPEEAGNSSESRSIKARSTGEGSFGSWRGCVDISNVAQGYVALRYKGSAKKISVEVIGKNNKVYKYFIERTKEPTYFPLTSGNGTYQISVYENVQDDEYSVLMMDSFEVKLKNKFSRPNVVTNRVRPQVTVQTVFKINLMNAAKFIHTFHHIKKYV